MTARRDLANVQASQLGFEECLVVRNIAFYDFLMPRLQELLFESKKFQRANISIFVGQRMASYIYAKRIHRLC